MTKTEKRIRELARQGISHYAAQSRAFNNEIRTNEIRNHLGPSVRQKGPIWGKCANPFYSHARSLRSSLNDPSGKPQIRKKYTPISTSRTPLSILYVAQAEPFNFPRRSWSRPGVSWDGFSDRNLLIRDKTK